MIDKLRKINRSLRLANGLYMASSGRGVENYSEYVWIRDTFYQNLPNLTYDQELYAQTYYTLLDFYKKFEDELKVSNNYPVLPIKIYRNLTKLEEWNHKQLDAAMLFLFGIVLGEKEGIKIIRNSQDSILIQNIINYYERVHYWNLAGTDAWEEKVELHSHAIGAAFAAFKGLQEIGFLVDNNKLKECANKLNNLLPYETESRFCDMAQLQLIWPLNIFKYEEIENKETEILDRIENLLVREKGVIRYMNDPYYNMADKESAISRRTPFKEGSSLAGNELEWTMGLSYLSIIYGVKDCFNKHANYLNKVIEPLSRNNDYRIPEGYYSGTGLKNDNTPLGWANAITIIALEKMKNYTTNEDCEEERK